MAHTTATRALTTGALAAAVVWAGAGTAAAAPPGDHWPTRTTTGYASAVLTGTTTPGMAVFFDAYAPDRTEPFGGLEVFVAGYECLTEDRVPATIDGLESATAAGELAFVCGSPEGEVTGSATVDLTWTGEGDVRHYVLAGPGFPCISFGRERQADVTGSVRVVIPELRIDESTIADDGSSRLTSVTSICLRGTE
jgi:hypothetical protein